MAGSKNKEIKEFLYIYAIVSLRKKNFEEKEANVFSHLFHDDIRNYKAKFIDRSPLIANWSTLLRYAM